jgi:16S rRNA processing protein RimM
MSASKKKHSGSPSAGEPEFLAIGHLRSAHGIQGEITLDPWTDFPERIKPGNHVFLGEEHTEVIVTGVRGKNQLLILQLKGYDQRETVNELRNQVVYTQLGDLPTLPEGQYYHHELIGLHVMDENDQEIGTIQEIIETGAKDVLVIRNHEKELLVPMINEVILSIDLPAGLVKIKPQRWD